jgi:hypothetical protein
MVCEQAPADGDKLSRVAGEVGQAVRGLDDERGVVAVVASESAKSLEGQHRGYSVPLRKDAKTSPNAWRI